jgi:hypothetical protein
MSVCLIDVIVYMISFMMVVVVVLVLMHVFFLTWVVFVGMNIILLRIIFCWYYTVENRYFMIWIFLSLILESYNLVQGSFAGMLSCAVTDVMLVLVHGSSLEMLSDDIIYLWIDDDGFKWPTLISWRNLWYIRNYEKYEILKTFLILIIFLYTVHRYLYVVVYQKYQRYNNDSISIW